MAKPNHFCSGYMWTFWYFDISVWPGEKILPFRTLPKQYEFSTIQGMRTEITLQTHANTSDIHKHHSYTPPMPPQTLSRHIQTTKEANTYQQTSADVNTHFQPTSNNTWEGLGMSGTHLGVSVCTCHLSLCLPSFFCMPKSSWGAKTCFTKVGKWYKINLNP